MLSGRQNREKINKSPNSFQTQINYFSAVFKRWLSVVAQD